MTRTAYQTHNETRPDTGALTTALTAALDLLDALDLPNLPRLVAIGAETVDINIGDQVQVQTFVRGNPATSRDAGNAAALAAWWRALTARDLAPYGWVVALAAYAHAHVAVDLPGGVGPLVLWAHLTPAVVNRWTIPARSNRHYVADCTGQHELTLAMLDDVAVNPPTSVLRSIGGGA